MTVGEQEVSRRKPSLVLLAGLAACGPVALSIYIPSLPAVARDLHADVVLVQITVWSYFLTLALGQLIIGPLSDRYGRRPVALGTLGLLVVSSLLAASASSIEQLIVWRVVQALAGASGMVLSRTIIKDVCSPQDMPRQLAHVVSISVIVPMLAPVLGGALADAFSWRTTLVAVALLALAVFLGAAFSLKETLTQRGPAQSSLEVVGVYADFLAQGRFLFMALSAALFGTTNFVFQTGMSFILEHNYNLNATTFGLWVTMLSASYMLGNQISARLDQRLSNWGKLALGTWISTVAVATMVLTSSLTHLPAWAPFVFMAFAGLGHGIGMSNAIAIALRSITTHSGAAVALLGAVQMTVSALGLVIVSVLQNGTLFRVFLVVAMAQAGALVAFLIERPRTPCP